MRVRNGKEALPENEDYGFERRTEKLRYLNQFLVQNAKGLTLARALSLSLAKWNRLSSGYDIPSRAIMNRAAVYFSLPPKMLLDDKEKLPAFEKLQIDEDLASIQRNDLEETMNYYKNKKYIARNYHVLSHAARTRLYLSLVIMMVPLLAFTGYSAYDILQNRSESIAKFQQTDTVDKTSKKFEESYIEQNPADATKAYVPCSVKVGLQVLKVFDIQPSNEYFSVAMKVWFDFSQDAFHAMYKNYNTSDTTQDALTPDATVYPQDNDAFTVSRADNAVTYGSDSIPDYIELATPFDLAKKVDQQIAADHSTSQSAIQESARTAIAANPSFSKLHNGWINERISYPGLTPSTIYNDFSPNFDVGKGVDADSLRYYCAPGEPYALYNGTSLAAASKREYRFFQCLRFTAKVSKAYDNPRYPLETAQFWINVEPADWLNVDNLRYEKADIVDVSNDQESNANGNVTGYEHCTIDELVYTTMGEEVAFTDGFRSINNYPSHAEGIEYDVNETYPGQSHSKFTVVIRANRAAFTASNFLPSTFLQTYINLAAVIIWIIIGFYNQTYAGEDSLGMLGTGMFSAISATIVGFQMLSDASMFSLITMINIFTLAVILIMTYQSVQAKKARARQDKAEIAYNGVKLRIMFYILTICTLIMFIGLPIAAYIWTV
jgi:hypothetical protein